ncbi:glycosyltransferase family 2 protein [Pelodictyon phaeoclathratiforme]|jgi:glycosyltransferase involved in cell wall biosynthesis|uniref:Glycosyl transferase family 2 n=1 Tax=Pelodictyon phaeoclathratiforme (strain DSM 5477 / BU-1) TaxID=324925 RepID=B4SGA8_PELPB|nr:glycosyltransferase family A protein [Pelodictyon phaeoclathratiforme]ACF43419.1 glycosyl transferase family 2 [Pelodictyon phaeoclathratiforme BU-1]MBV5288552.1 glycosyltransferase family 2 protein [Pelodictyon phaeoclathratiforme]
MKGISRPDISIIMPTFNRANHLECAIHSVLAQSFSNWELIIVDDGSNDNTFEKLDPFILKFPNIRYMKQSNRKAALARNTGIQASFGRYITFLDSDDHYLKNHLETRITLIEEMQDVSMLSGGFLCDETITVKDCYHPDSLVGIRECILCGTLFGKRELFFALDGFSDMEYAEDTDLWERASRLFSLKKIEEPKTYVYQRASDSITLNR